MSKKNFRTYNKDLYNLSFAYNKAMARKFATNSRTRVKLMQEKYKGFNKIEKITDDVAILYSDKEQELITGHFKRLKSDKTYYIGDIIEHRVDKL